MKAIAVFPQEKSVRIIDHSMPSIAKATEVKMRILEVGICGTDRDICSFQYGTAPDDCEYLVIGHEALAEVVEIGPAVSRFSVGDLVVPMVRRGCPQECFACRHDRQDFCITGEFQERGIKKLHGFMTEYIVDDEKYLALVPRVLRDVAILTEPLTIAQKAWIQVQHIQRRLPWGSCQNTQYPGYCHTAVVLGAGPIGLLGAMTLLNAGFETIVYSRGSPSNIESLVRSIGGTFVSSDEESPRHLCDRLGHIDLVYEATGAAQVSFEMMEALGPNSIMVFTGIPGLKGSLDINASLIMRNLVLKNQIFFGTVNADYEAFEMAVKDLASFREKWPQALSSLISGLYPIDSYADLLVETKRGIKDIISFDSSWIRSSSQTAASVSAQK